MSCCAPCSPLPVNTAAAELLPSQIENFTKQFFGDIVKTDVNGVVEWVLPCNLDIGLENNTREAGEGLACYFLRLFREGIVGLTGPQGATGVTGTNGANAFTVTLTGFTQPTLAAPSIQVQTAYNPAIVSGLNVFIQGSGWYHIDTTSTTGILFLTLTKPLSGVSGFISAGKLVIPAGYPGESIVGPAGPTGPQGPVGPAGESLTEANGQYRTDTGVDYALQAISTAVNFTTSSPSLLLPAAGRYLLTAIVSIEGETGVLANDIISLKLFNLTIAGDVLGSEQEISNLVDGQRTQVVLHAIYQADGANQTIALYGDCTTSDVVSVIADNTVFTYVRIE